MPVWRALNYYAMIPILEAEESLREIRVLQAGNPLTDEEHAAGIIAKFNEIAFDSREEDNPYALRDALAGWFTPEELDPNVRAEIEAKRNA